MVVDGFLKDYVADAQVEDQILALQGPLKISKCGLEGTRVLAEFAIIPLAGVTMVLTKTESLPADLRRAD